jgi:hypothetical protein
MNFALGGLVGSGVFDASASAGPAALLMGLTAVGLLVAGAAVLVLAACGRPRRRPVRPLIRVRAAAPDARAA